MDFTGRWLNVLYTNTKRWNYVTVFRFRRTNSIFLLWKNCIVGDTVTAFKPKSKQTKE